MARKGWRTTASARMARHTDATTRIRLLALETERGRLDIGGLGACVCAPVGVGCSVADTIARAVIGPRAAGVDGVVEIAGQHVALHCLPAPLLRPSAPPTIDRAVLEDLWHDTCAPRRAKVAAEHAARRLERHRTIVAIERVHQRVGAGEGRNTGASNVPTTWQPTPAPGPQSDENAGDDTRALERLLDELDSLVPVPSPDALRVASELEHLLANPPTLANHTAVETDIDTLEARVADAYAVVAEMSGGLLPTLRQRVAQCHHDVTEAERALFESNRRGRRDALAAYETALAEERVALTEAGVESYVSFLVAVVACATHDDLHARLRAEIELAQAEADLATARSQLSAMTKAQHAARADALRRRAEEILGHAPGDDVVAELSAVRIDHPSAADLRDQLRELGIGAGDDVVAGARAAVAARRSEGLQSSCADTPVVREHVDDAGVLDIALHTLIEARGAHDAELARLDAELEAIDAQRTLGVAAMDAATMRLLIATLVARYRAGELLAGRLPMVLDCVFDDIATATSASIAEYVAGLDDIQMIVVTTKPAVADTFRAAGVLACRVGRRRYRFGTGTSTGSRARARSRVGGER